MDSPRPPTPAELLAYARGELSAGREDQGIDALLAAALLEGADPEVFHLLGALFLRRGRPGVAARWFLRAPRTTLPAPEILFGQAQALLAARLLPEVERMAEEIRVVPQLASFATGLMAYVAMHEDRIATALALLEEGRSHNPADFNLLLLTIQCLARLSRDDELSVLVEEGVKAARSLGQPALEEHIWAQVRQTEFSGRITSKDRLYIRDGSIVVGTTTDDGVRIDDLRSVRFDVPALCRTLFRLARLRDALGFDVRSVEAADERSEPLARAASITLGVPCRGPEPGEDPSGAWWVQDLCGADRPPPVPTARPRFVLVMQGDATGEAAVPEVIGVVTAEGGSFPWRRSSAGSVSPLLFSLSDEAVRREPEMGNEQFLAALRERHAHIVPEPNDVEQVAYYAHRHRRLRRRIEPRIPAVRPEPGPPKNPLSLLVENEPVPLTGALRHLWKQRSIPAGVAERLAKLFGADPGLRSAILPVLERFAPKLALERVLALPQEEDSPGPTRGDYLATLRTAAVLPELRRDLSRRPETRRVGLAFPDFRLGAFLHQDDLPEVIDEVASRPGGLATVLAFAGGIPPVEAPALAPRLAELIDRAFADPASAPALGAALAACAGGWGTAREDQLGPLLESPIDHIRERALRLLVLGQAGALAGEAKRKVRGGEIPWSAAAAAVLLLGEPDLTTFARLAVEKGLPQGTVIEEGFLGCLAEDSVRDALLSEIVRHPTGEEILLPLLVPLFQVAPRSDLVLRWLPRTRPYLLADSALAAIRFLAVHGAGSEEENAFVRSAVSCGGSARFEGAALLLERGQQRFRETLTLQFPARPPEEGPGIECLAYLGPALMNELGERLIEPLERPGGELLIQRALVAFLVGRLLRAGAAREGRGVGPRAAVPRHAERVLSRGGGAAVPRGHHRDLRPPPGHREPVAQDLLPARPGARPPRGADAGFRPPFRWSAKGSCARCGRWTASSTTSCWRPCRRVAIGVLECLRKSLAAAEG